jgi:hypothetical protein
MKEKATESPETKKVNFMGKKRREEYNIQKAQKEQIEELVELSS